MLLLWTTGRAVAQQSMWIRLAWGGNTERLWEGTIAVSQGSLAEPRPLGIEADEPGSMWVEDGRIVVRQRSGRLYDGLDLLLDAPLETATLLVEFAAADKQQPARVEVPIEELLDGPFSADLDNRGTRLLVRRTPGDELRVEFERQSLVFSPGEVFSVTVTPHLLPGAGRGRRQLRAQLYAGRSSRLVWEHKPIALSERSASVPVSVPLSLAEGVYDLVITVVEAPGLRLPQVGRVSLGPWQTVVRRKLQLLVLDPKPPVVPLLGEQPLQPVEQIDPANPKWWERFARLPPQLQLPALKRPWNGPLGSGDSKTRHHPLGELVQLDPSSPANVSWEAYTLPIKRPGAPHVLEVEYPSDVPQTLGISVMEPNAAGALMPIQLDSGVDLAEEVTGGSGADRPRMLRHRLIFWPRTKAPIVLMTNYRHGSPAVYGKIRLLAGWDHLPRAFPVGGQPPERLLAAYLDRPLFPESFCASEAYDNWSHRSLDDWTTFYEGGRRLVEYLNHVGLNGLMISVLADGSTIYPSKILQPTPRYDKGIFFASGQDPIRKDVLEMLFRLFDREQLQLIPALEFSSPLPELEELLREGGPHSLGIRWIGPEGISWQQVYQPHRRMAPYYNVLHPRVQEAMLAVVQELVGAYAANHESFAGLAIQLAGYGYAQLPGPEWGMDDVTIAQFERDTGTRLQSSSGTERFAKRKELLLGEYRRQWLRWRCDRLGRFYRRLHKELTAIRPDARLYLAGANMLTGEELEYRLRPSLPRRLTMARTLFHLGIDVADYNEQEGLVLLRSRRIAPLGSPAAGATQLEVDQMPDRDRCFRQLSSPGSLFFHQPQELRVASFDGKSPFRPSYVSLTSQLSPSVRQNRRRLVHSLATLDAQMIFDGGWLMPLGQEDSIRGLVAAYRRLPAVRFERLSDPPPPNSIQPVTIRYSSHAGHTFVYAVNDSPLATTVRMHVEGPAGCRLEELTGRRRDFSGLKRSGGETYWEIKLGPYDLVAGRFSTPGVKLSRPRVSLAKEVHTTLETRIRRLSTQAATLRGSPPLEVLSNPAFENPPETTGKIPGWITSNQNGPTVQLITTQNAEGVGKPPGTQSVRLESNGPVTSLVSELFAAPSTGRLSIRVWLRAPDAAYQPAFRLGLSGRLGQEGFSRVAMVGRAPGNGPNVEPIKSEWSSYIFPINDLPLTGLSDLQVRFDLIGPGEVWVDDVQLYHLDFPDDEHLELVKLITLAHLTLQNGQLRDCIHLLEGYWPRFLEANVPLRPALAHRPHAEKQTPPKPASTPQRSAGLLDRMKRLMPKKLW